MKIRRQPPTHPFSPEIWRNDARYLAIELAAGRPTRPIDVMALGLVLEAGEQAYRWVHAYLSQFDSAYMAWPRPVATPMLVTDQGLIARLGSGPLVSLWWTGISGLGIDLEREQVTLDYGDGQPRAILGPWTPHIAICAVAANYGVEALLAHPRLTSLRRPDFTASN